MTKEEREELKAKSLGEKLCDAIHLPLMYTSRAPWSTLGLDSRGSYEVAALAFAASLTHDETANAVIASLTARAEKAEEALYWALGEGPEDDFPPREEGQGAFWWRKELRLRCGLPVRISPDSQEATHV